MVLTRSQMRRKHFPKCYKIAQPSQIKKKIKVRKVPTKVRKVQETTRVRKVQETIKVPKVQETIKVPKVQETTVAVVRKVPTKVRKVQETTRLRKVQETRLRKAEETRLRRVQKKAALREIGKVVNFYQFLEPITEVEYTRYDAAKMVVFDGLTVTEALRVTKNPCCRQTVHRQVRKLKEIVHLLPENEKKVYPYSVTTSISVSVSSPLTMPDCFDEDTVYD